ncbi:hypothetical protein D3P08_01895 [Paenibacillus nanensis]|uniref:Uncharacterized protein n=1 Tax=Paenibacillus nanensis TaxID=393251 RepID=A0A3A1VKR0_9BACL|nr:hypothetical protein [Paenibacillus nanensis]RIX60342.1 hypothetical protein D3P08_01895 [Paenibacillus nanensis]
MRLFLNRKALFLLFHGLFIIPVVFSTVMIAAQMKASLSIGELLGFTREHYDFMERFGINEENIIDVFAEGEISADFYKEQERAVLRDYNFPNPFYFYFGFVILLVYLGLYYYFAKTVRTKTIIVISPLIITILICAYFIAAYSENDLLLLGFWV